MTDGEKRELVAAALDIGAERLLPETPLKSLEEWDSMGMISIMALMDKHFDKRLIPEQLGALSSVRELFDLMNK